MDKSRAALAGDVSPPPLTIGRLQDGGARATLPPESLRRHLVCFGASGSGKTVLAKAIIEEAVRAGIPSVIIDPQGDLASLAVPADPAEVESHAGDAEIAKDYAARAEVRIFTPASGRGIPLTVPMFDLPDPLLPEEDRIQASDVVASSLIQLLGYDERGRKSAGARALVYTILKAAQEKDRPIRNFDELVAAIRDPKTLGLAPDASLGGGERKALAQDIGHLTTGVTSLLFGRGIPIDIEVFRTPITPGKVPVNVIFLNSLTAEHHRQFVVAMVAAATYRWMLRNPPPEGQDAMPQLLLYVDEVAPFLPPHPRNPPAKGALQLLYKQGRKFGIACMVATQNVADVEYKAFANAATWCLGRMMARQDLEKLKHLLKSRPPEEYERLMTAIPSLQARQFLVVSPDVFPQGPVEITARWLATVHRTIDLETIREILAPSVREAFEGRMATLIEPTRTETDAGPTAGPAPGLATTPPTVTPAATTGTGESAPADARPAGRWLPVVQLSKIKVPMNEAQRRIQAWPGGLTRQGEELVTGKAEYLVLWRAGLTVERPDGLMPFVQKKVKAQEHLYFDAMIDTPSSGQLLHVEKDMIFTPITTKQAHEIVDLDGHATYEAVNLSQLPFRTSDFPLVAPEVVTRRIKNLFGVFPSKMELVVLPVWRFVLRQGTGFQARARTILVDSLFCKEIVR